MAKDKAASAPKRRPYCFLGPELGEKQEAIAEIRRKLATDTPGSGISSINSGIEETVFYAGETKISEIVSLMLNGSLFSDQRLFLIKNAELIKEKDDVALLASCLENPQQDTTVILISDGASIDRKLEQASEKRIFWELFEDRKIEWVASFFRRRGCRISPEGIEMILELVENNTDALGRECSRLIAFLGNEKTIATEDVETWLSHSREESVFSLFSRIAAGDLARSVETLHTLLDAKESPAGIIAVLAWSFRKFRDYLALVTSGVRDEFEFKKIGLGSKRAREDHAALSRRYNSAEGALALLAEFDLLTRSLGSPADAILLDLLIVKLVRGTETREQWYYY